MQVFLQYLTKKNASRVFQFQVFKQLRVAACNDTFYFRFLTGIKSDKSVILFAAIPKFFYFPCAIFRLHCASQCFLSICRMVPDFAG
jgi:hypothetical protein